MNAKSTLFSANAGTNVTEDLAVVVFVLVVSKEVQLELLKLDKLLLATSVGGRSSWVSIKFRTLHGDNNSNITNPEMDSNVILFFMVLVSFTVQYYYLYIGEVLKKMVMFGRKRCAVGNTRYEVRK